MRKPAFCIICENKDADELHVILAADWRPCFSYIDSAIPLLSSSNDYTQNTVGRSFWRTVLMDTLTRII